MYFQDNNDGHNSKHGMDVTSEGEAINFTIRDKRSAVQSVSLSLQNVQRLVDYIKAPSEEVIDPLIELILSSIKEAYYDRDIVVRRLEGKGYEIFHEERHYYLSPDGKWRRYEDRVVCTSVLEAFTLIKTSLFTSKYCSVCGESWTDDHRFEHEVSGNRGWGISLSDEDLTVLRHAFQECTQALLVYKQVHFKHIQEHLPKKGA